MKFGIVVFPGSNCDRDMQDALQNDLNKEVKFYRKRIVLLNRNGTIIRDTEKMLIPGGVR